MYYDIYNKFIIFYIYYYSMDYIIFICKMSKPASPPGCPLAQYPPPRTGCRSAHCSHKYGGLLGAEVFGGNPHSTLRGTLPGKGAWSGLDSEEEGGGRTMAQKKRESKKISE